MWISRDEWKSMVEAAARVPFLDAERRGLKDSLAYFQSAYEREKQRADNAVDELLIARGQHPVTPSPQSTSMSIDAMFEEDPEEVEKILSRKMTS